MPWIIAGGALLGAVVGAKSNKDASKASQAGADTAAVETRRAADEARADIFKLFPASQAALAGGYQGAADIFSQSAPQQADIFQQGNVAAQQQVAAGMPQFQNAILGGQVDYNQFQPAKLQQPDFGFMQNQQFESPDPFNPLAGMTNEQIQNATAQQPPVPFGHTYPDGWSPSGGLGSIYGPAQGSFSSPQPLSGGGARPIPAQSSNMMRLT